MVECASCGNEIDTGEVRYPADEGTKHKVCAERDSLFDKYHFYITNPGHEDGHGFSMWRMYDEREHPVLTYSEGLMTVNSSSPKYSGSDAIEPSEGFFNSVAYSVHSVMAVSPLWAVDNKIEEEIEHTIDSFYDAKPPEHEEKCINTLVYQILPQTFPYVIAELKPIRDYTDMCTEFSIPDVHPVLE